MSTPSRGPNVFCFNLPGLALFSSALVLTGSAVTFGVRAVPLPAARTSAGDHARDANERPDRQWRSVKGPWGELLVSEIELERPEEYIGYDASPRTETWTFGGSTPDQVRELLLRSHVSAAQIERALSPQMMSVGADGVVITPDDDLVLSLSPASRDQLYRVLGKNPKNSYMHQPFELRPGDAQRWFSDSSFDPSLIALFQKLLYPRGDVMNFSDYEMIMQRIPREADRRAFAKTLSRQHALLLGLRVGPETDIDKMLGYWTAEAVHPKDLRPMFEALKRLPEGGSLNIAYVLPPFARARLYTFPEPNSNPQSPVFNCHWSTLNFFRDPPDDRFADEAYGVAYVHEHFYEIAKPSMYGDRIVLVDDQGGAIHSAVYIAADIVFTKNGGGFAQPWMMMSLQDMIRMYGSSEHVRMIVYRDKTR
jgi:hypothetical protein